MGTLLNLIDGPGAIVISAIACSATIALTFVSHLKSKQSRLIWSIICVLTAIVAEVAQGYGNYCLSSNVSAMPKRVVEEQENHWVNYPTTSDRRVVRDAIFRMLKARGFWPRCYGENTNGDIEYLYASSEVQPDDGAIFIPSFDFNNLVGQDDEDTDSRIVRYFLSEKPFVVFDCDVGDVHTRFCEYCCFIAAGISQENVSWHSPDGTNALYLEFKRSEQIIAFGSKDCLELKKLTRLELVKHIAEIMTQRNLTSGKMLYQEKLK